MNLLKEDVLAVISAILALSRRLRAERLKGGITLTGVSILSALRRCGPLPSNGLAEVEGLEPQSLTRLLAELERRGLISRVRSELDRRTVLVSLTDAGEAELQIETERWGGWLEKAIALALDDNERPVIFAATDAMAKLARFDDLGDAMAREQSPG